MPSIARVPRGRRSGSHRTGVAPWTVTLTLVLSMMCARLASAQATHHNHDDEFEFTHPLVTESPSPDTKIRLDFTDLQLGEDGVDAGEQSYRLEAEYAFQPWVSIEVNVPYVTRHIGGRSAGSGVGSAEAALKLASFRLAERGILLGGGVEFGLPTGQSSEGIGSDHLVEVSPYADIGYMRGSLELVGFTNLSFTTNRRIDEPAERELEYSFSGMYHFTPVVSGLLELDGASALAGEESGTSSFNLSPGILVHPRVDDGHLLFGISAGFPITGARELDRRILFSAFYHF